MVAILHSFVGLAAVFVGISSHLEPGVPVAESEMLIHEIEIFIGVFIGAITFTGSVIAFLKLKGSSLKRYNVRVNICFIAHRIEYGI